ncbi:MAG: ABC transporter permease [Acidobacteriaceae bacterium]|nr:ABC transporter permease [Acidobacteriaceae bacterium]
MLGRYIDILKLRLRSLFRRQSVDRELSKELQFHFDELVAENIRAGMSASEARYAAGRSMGGLAQIQEGCRDWRGLSFLDHLLQDLRYSLRVLRRSPVFTSVAILSLALGIGANTLMFSVVQSILLRPLPYKQPAELYSVTQVSSQRLNESREIVLSPDFAEWREESHAFSGFAAWNGTDYTLTGISEPQRLSAALVNADFFNTLGVYPALGHGFTLRDDGSQPARLVMLSDQLWKRQFGGNRGIIDRTITLSGKGYTVIGVLPPSFRFPGDFQPELFAPGGFSGPAQWGAQSLAFLKVTGRIHKGISKQEATRELEAINQRHLSEIPIQYRRGFGHRVVEVTPLQNKLVGDLRPSLLVLLGAVILILLITCSNMAALQLARGLARSSELAIRLALGSGHRRVLNLLMTESAMLAGVGGLLGVLGAYALLPAVRTVKFLHLSSPSDISMNSTVLAMAIVLTLSSAILFGIGPALAASKQNLHEAIKPGSRSLTSKSNRMRSVLVAAQIAFALVLLLSAGLLLKSTAKVLSNPLGLQPSGVLGGSFVIDEARYSSQQKMIALGEELTQRVGRLPGVESTALTSALPFNGYHLGASLVLDGQPVPPPGARPMVPVIAITPAYFRTLRVPFLVGREFTASDRLGAPLVAIVNQSFVQRFFPNADPIGRRVRWGADGSPWATVVGIATDIRHRGQDIDPIPELFVPFFQFPHSGLALAIRTTIPPNSLISAVRKEFARVDRQLPITDLQSMNDRISQHAERRRLELMIIGGFAALAFFLAVAGVYGVMAYVVTKRTREFGVRLALGAEPSDITRNVVTRGIWLTLCGLLPGLTASYFLTRYLSSLLYKVNVHDFAIFSTASGVLFLAAGLASYFPARRASRTDPVSALRWE